MGNGVHISQKRKVRRNKQKAEPEIKVLSAVYLHDFTLAITFSKAGIKFTRPVDFLPLFQKYVKGDNLKYFAPTNFKKFIIKNGNIFWGKNEDVIFPSQQIFNINYKGSRNEEILYVI
jgi:hypothetical protein